MEVIHLWTIIRRFVKGYIMNLVIRNWDLKTISKSQQLANSSSKEDEVQAADACASAGDLAGAVEHLNVALVYDGADAGVLTRRAELQLKQKIYDAAVADGDARTGGSLAPRPASSSSLTS